MIDILNLTIEQSKTYMRRLEKVWNPDWVEQWYDEYQGPDFRARLEERGHISVYVHIPLYDDPPYRCRVVYNECNQSVGVIFFGNDEEFGGSAIHSGDYEGFLNDYLDPVRRMMWLSGANIQASAHEKAEWMQGLTKEEVKTWNLCL